MSLLPRWLTPLQTLMSLLMFVEMAVILGTAVTPALALWLKVYRAFPPESLAHLWVLSVALIGAYLLFGLTLLVVVPLFRWLTLSFGTPAGTYPYASFKGYQWASYNMLTLLVRFSFVNWVRATPFIVWFHRAMGMRIGKRVQINTAVIADQNLISIGDDSVIGGDVTLIGHSAEGSRIVAAPVTIGNRVTVGLMAVILPGCTIGDGAMIAANAVLPKGTQVGPGEIWGGIPARRIGHRPS